MGRELRRVPKDWEHPKDSLGRYIPMRDGDHVTACKEWLARCIAWQNEPPERRKIAEYYWQHERPPEDYGERGCPMFKSPRDDLTHYMLYESTSEGTPLSPAFETIEEVAAWAAENASTFGNFRATKEEWFEMLSDGVVYAESGNMTFI